MFTIVYADRLEKTYLPPTNSRTAGGNGNFLAAPFANGIQGKSNFHVASVNSKFSNTYLPPSNSRTVGGNNKFPFKNNLQGKSSFKVTPNNSRFSKITPSNSFGRGTSSTFNNRQSSGFYNRDSSKQIPILRYDNQNNGDGSYHFE